MAKVFTKLTVQPLFLGGTSLQWSLHPQFLRPFPWRFTVEWGRSGNPDGHDWRTLGTFDVDSVRSCYSFMDMQQRLWSNHDRLYYRVRVMSENAEEFFSDPTTVWGLPRDRFLIAREILRGRQLLFRKKVGLCGWLFRRRDWGTRCTQKGCLDYDTNVVTNTDCPTCYGTGWVGGYYTPVPYHLMVTKNKGTDIQDMEGRGQVGDIARDVECLACPTPRPRDVFLDAGSDERWLFTGIDISSEFVGYPLLLECEQHLAPPTHIIQTLTPEHQS